MIKSFKDREAGKLFRKEISKKLPRDIQRASRRKLLLLNQSQNIQDLKSPPSNHFKKLKGSRKDTYSIRINKQWRLCFKWKNNNAYDVEIIDYHS